MPKPAKRFVYILRSVNDPERRYIGMGSRLLYLLAYSPPGTPTSRFMRYRGPMSKNNVWRYDIGADTWLKLPNAPW